MSLITETTISQLPVSSGRWTKEEHQRFVEAIQTHGKNWKKVEECVGTRSGAQIRSHAQKFFLKIEKDVKPNKKGTSKSSKKAFEASISTDDNLSVDNLKGNLSFNEISENLTEASENVTVVPITCEDVPSSQSNVMQAENSGIDYSKLSKAQLLSKLQACEEKVDVFHQFVKNFTANYSTDATTQFRTPFSGKSYHHFVYLDLMSYFGGFNKSAKSLKISDFVDHSYKANTNNENSYEAPVGMKKVKVL